MIRVTYFIVCLLLGITLVSCIRVLQKSSQFTRAIRKTASAMLSAAAQLIFAHNKALPS